MDNYFDRPSPGIVYIEDIPRVTEILSAMLHEDTLMNWANSLGFRRINYRKEVERSADIGTSAHNAAENILRNKSYDEYLGLFFQQKELQNCINSFIDWYEEVKNKIEVLFMEVPLCTEKFRGTYDLLARINDKIYLVDFKTSNHIGYRYFLQLAAYRYMIERYQNIKVDGCLILQLSKKERKFSEYVLEFSIPEHLSFINHCETTFLSLVEAYRNRKIAEDSFKYIF